MARSPWIYVVFFYVKGKIVAAHPINVYSIAINSAVVAAAANNNVVYDDYIPVFIHA